MGKHATQERRRELVCLRLGAAARADTAARAQDDCTGYLASVNGVCRRGDYGYDTCPRTCGLCTPRDAAIAAVARAARARRNGLPARQQRRRRGDLAARGAAAEEGKLAALGAGDPAARPGQPGRARPAER